MMLGQTQKAAVPESQAFYRWLQGKQSSDLPEGLVAIEKQTLSREWGGDSVTIQKGEGREETGQMDARFPSDTGFDRQQFQWDLAVVLIPAC